MAESLHSNVCHNEHEPAVPWQAGGPTLSWGASDTAAGKERGLSCSALARGGLILSAGGSFGHHNVKKDIEPLESIQRRPQGWWRVWRETLWGAAEVTWSAQPKEDETEGRPHWALQHPHKGKQRGRNQSVHSGDQWQDLRKQPEAESQEV